MKRFFAFKKQDSSKKLNELSINYRDTGKKESFKIQDDLELHVVTLPSPIGAQNENEFIHQLKWTESDIPKHVIVANCRGPKSVAALQQTYKTILQECKKREAAILHLNLVGTETAPLMADKPVASPNKPGLKLRSLSAGNLCLLISKANTPEEKLKSQNDDTLGYSIINSLKALITALREFKTEKNLLLCLHIPDESRYDKIIEYLDTQNIPRQPKPMSLTLKT